MSSKWLRRQWQAILLAFLIAISLYLLFSLRKDDSFSYLSPFLGLIIGALATALGQLLTKEHEREARRADKLLEIKTGIRKRRIEYIDQFFSSQASTLLNILNMQVLGSIAHSEGRPEQLEGIRAQIGGLLDNYETREDITGRGSVYALADDDLVLSLEEFESILMDLSKIKISDYNIEEFQKHKEDIQGRAFSLMGRVYKGLDDAEANIE